MSEIERPEIIVNKVGGTSNATAESVALSMEWADDALVTVVSAPGKLTADQMGTIRGVEDNDSAEFVQRKVTDHLLNAYDIAHRNGDISRIADMISMRYEAIDNGLNIAMPKSWYGAIPQRLNQAIATGRSQASILGEQLMAEMYEGAGFQLLDVAKAKNQNLGIDPEQWRSVFQGLRYGSSQKNVLAGNVTTINGITTDVSRGGSDTVAGLVSYGAHATHHRNLTDGGARTADPRIVKKGTQPIEHLLYDEGRELGLSGTGLVHPAAMVPLARGGVVTEIRSTFDREAPFTVMDSDYERAESRATRAAAISLMNDVVVIEIHEPGMAEARGRLDAFSSALSRSDINIIDSDGNGFDRQQYMVNANEATLAAEALSEVTVGWADELEVSEPQSLVSIVGYQLGERILNNYVMMSFLSTPTLRGERWQLETPYFKQNRHSLRLGVRPEDASTILKEIHDQVVARN